MEGTRAGGGVELTDGAISTGGGLMEGGGWGAACC